MTDIQDPKFREELRRAHRTAAFLGQFLMAGLIPYLLIEEIVRASLRPFTGLADVENRLALRYAFYAAAVAVVIALRFLNGALLRRGRDRDARAALRRLSQANLVTLALADIPAFLGLALFLIGGYNWDFYVLLFVSLGLMFMFFPRLRTWEAALQNAPPTCPF